MKPYKNFLFFLTILAALAGTVLFFGGSTLDLTEDFQLKIPTFSNPSVEEKTSVVVKEYVMTEAEKASFLAIDSSALAFPELQDIPYHPFDYATTEEHPLISFFEHLSMMNDSTELIRILHYGDSQIEGDRISSSIRHYLQSTFGGFGPGAVPLFSPVNVSSYVVNKSVDWTKKTITDRSPANDLSAWMGYLQGDSENSSSLQLRVSPYVLYPSASRFSNVHILASSSQNPININVSDKMKNVYTCEKQNIGEYFSLINIPVDTSLRDCKIVVKNAEKSQIYGVSLDSKYGIAVDNLPLRGSAGYIFTRQNAPILRESFQFLNVGLILFQFGVNAVHNNPKHPVNSKGLENALRKELFFLKSLVPNVPIVVIGVSDRAYKNGVEYETNPNVLLVRDAQKNAAILEGCAFWDLFESMGGERSIVNWVNQKPALAGRDYTHFSAKGAQRVGEMFYKSLMIEYLNYLKKQKEIALEQKLHALNEQF